ncbi:MAG: metallophosphoesterase family protein [Planctomycetes bacterium]|nr:metallophosphoesterase family protein [Planctomycetota bacterium]
MRAIISDIHGNLEALRRVLDYIGRLKGIEAIYCIGDVIGYGPQPVECLRLSKEFRINLIGNHEEALLSGPHLFNKMAENAIKWTQEQVDLCTDAEDLWEFVEKMAYYHVDGPDLYVHASPRDCCIEYINPRDIRDQPDKIQDIFTYVQSLCFVGHTHLPGIFTSAMNYVDHAKAGRFKVHNGVKHIVNIGSVGQPRDGDPRACFVTYDGNEVVYHRVEYDVKKTAERIYHTPMLDRVLGDRLLVGK